MNRRDKVLYEDDRHKTATGYLEGEDVMVPVLTQKDRGGDFSYEMRDSRGWSTMRLRSQLRTNTMFRGLLPT